MTRGRIITVLTFLAIAGVGLTALMAASDVGDKPADPPKTTVSGKKLVCLATVDTESRIAQSRRTTSRPRPRSLRCSSRTATRSRKTSRSSNSTRG